MEKLFLSSKELSIRWGVTLKTLRQWRWKNKGPNFSKISGHAAYKLEDVKAFEESRDNQKIIKEKSKDQSLD
jgi:hypothetical protein